MKRAKLASIVLFSLSALMPVAATSCGGVAQQVGTETGNPPTLDKLRLRLEVRERAVEVIGEPGAVSPGGASVTVRNLATGETRTVTAGSDGSFRVTLGGGLEDGYEVTVSVGGVDTTVDVDTEMPMSPASCDAPSLLLQGCGSPSCHGSASTFSAFAVSEASFEEFVDVPAEVAPCASSGFIIDSANPSESLLLRKLDPEPPCGTRMPLGNILPEDDVACIESWLQSFGASD